MEENQTWNPRNKMAGGIAVSKYLYSNILDCGKIGRENQRKEFSENKESGKKESLCKQQVLRSRNIDILISDAAVRIRDDEASQRGKEGL